jgi:hypothetical protein
VALGWPAVKAILHFAIGDNLASMRFFGIHIAMIGLALIAGAYLTGECQAEDVEATTATDDQLTLVQYLMCESIEELEPKNPAIVFSINVERVICYSVFDPVPQKTAIYHNWYRRDVLNTRIKLSLQPPRWRTYSNIQLRETDKGPWRVEITDADGRVLGILRFSITD